MCSRQRQSHLRVVSRLPARTDRPSLSEPAGRPPPAGGAGTALELAHRAVAGGSLPGRVESPALPEPAPPRSCAFSFVSFRLRGGDRPNCHIMQRFVDLEHIKQPHLYFRSGSRSFPRGASCGERRGCRDTRPRGGGADERGSCSATGRLGSPAPPPSASSSGPLPSFRVSPAMADAAKRMRRASPASPSRALPAFLRWCAAAGVELSAKVGRRRGPWWEEVPRPRVRVVGLWAVPSTPPSLVLGLPSGLRPGFGMASEGAPAGACFVNP